MASHGPRLSHGRGRGGIEVDDHADASSMLLHHSHNHDHEDEGTHNHAHSHDHSVSQRKVAPETSDAQRKLKKATVFVLCFFVVEVVGGLWAGSLAVITDAAHLLTDVSSFILAIVAQEISGRPASGKLTYGWVRAEVLSALISTMFIVFLSAVLAYEAVHRIIDYSKGEGEEVNGKVMTIVAAIGLIVNIILLWILGDEHGGHGHDHGHHEHGPEQQEALAHGASINNADPERGNALHKHSHEHSHSSSHHSHTEEESSSGEEDEEEGAAYGTFSQQGVQGHSNQGVVHKKKIININVSAAFLHAVSDLIQSVGVLLAGIVIWVKPEWKLADPISTLFFTMLVVNSTRYLLSHATTILLEGVPDDVNYEQLKVKLRAIEGVTDVHCLHIWSLTLGRTIVTAHIKAVDPDFALGQAHTVLEQMGIFHSTIQVQKDACVNEACTHACVSSASRCC